MEKIDGKLVREKRKALGLSQRELGKRIGITKAGISKLELLGFASTQTRMLLNQTLEISLPLNVRIDIPLRKDALNSAYEVCIVMKDHCGNVLATDKNENDEFLYSHANNFIKWYENLNSRQLSKEI